MTTTASSTVVNRTSRVRSAAAAMAYVYLRLLREGHSVRASVVLAEFQRYWSQSRQIIVPDPPPFSEGIPPDLRASGMLDQETQNAVMFVLWQNGLITDQTAQIQGSGVSVLLTQVYPEIRPMGPDTIAAVAYEAALRGPQQDAGIQVRNWAFSYVEALDDESNLYEELARSNDATVPGAPPSHIGPSIPVFATPLRRREPKLWGFALALGLGALLFAGFTYRRFTYRRPRRRRR